MLTAMAFRRIIVLIQCRTVLGGNIPAERTYTKMGFKYLKTLSMFYEDTGWTDYMVFELIL